LLSFTTGPPIKSLIFCEPLFCNQKLYRWDKGLGHDAFWPVGFLILSIPEKRCIDLSTPMGRCRILSNTSQRGIGSSEFINILFSNDIYRMNCSFCHKEKLIVYPVEEKYRTGSIYCQECFDEMKERRKCKLCGLTVTFEDFSKHNSGYHYGVNNNWNDFPKKEDKSSNW
jgi:hypothetical protein